MTDERSGAERLLLSGSRNSASNDHTKAKVPWGLVLIRMGKWRRRREGLVLEIHPAMSVGFEAFEENTSELQGQNCHIKVQRTSNNANDHI